MSTSIYGRQLSFDEIIEIDLRDPPEPADSVPPPEPEPEPEPEPVVAGPPAPAPLRVDVIRSAKRKKTSQARLRGDVVEVRIPAWFSAEQEDEVVAHFVGKFERARERALIDVEARARMLAARHDLPLPASIRWVSNQNDRWGSCTPSRGTVRLSDRMAGFPAWVIDYVIMHELAHLVHADHSPAFWEVVARYPRAERARGYLMAKAGDESPCGSG